MLIMIVNSNFHSDYVSNPPTFFLFYPYHTRSQPLPYLSFQLLKLPPPLPLYFHLHISPSTPILYHQSPVEKDPLAFIHLYV